MSSAIVGTGRTAAASRRSVRSRLTVATVALGLLVACGGDGTDPESDPSSGTGETEDAAPFYEGRSIEWLTPFDPGGGNDIQARYFSPLLEESIAGNPEIQVTNVGGAGGVIGTNQYAQSREPNGESVVWTTGSTNIAWLLQEEGVEFDMREFTPIFCVPSGIVTYVSASTGITSLSDLANSPEPLVFGAQSASGSGALLLMAWDLLGVEVQGVFGYGSGGEVVIAFEQEEINLANASTTVYNESIKPWVDDGSAVPLFSLGQIEDGELIRDPMFPDLPHLGEAYEEINGSEPSGELWDAYIALVAAQNTYQKVAWMHAEAPAEAVEAVRAGMAQVVEEQSGTDEWLTVMGEYEVLYEDVEETVQAGMLDISPSVGEWIVAWLNEHYADDLG